MPPRAAHGVDGLVVATPDDLVGAVAASVEPDDLYCVVLHLAAALGLEVLGPHSRRASLHPLVPLPNADIGAARLRSGIGFAVAGDPLAEEVAVALGGRPFSLSPMPTEPRTTPPPAWPPTTWWRCSGRWSASRRRPDSTSTPSWTSPERRSTT